MRAPKWLKFVADALAFEARVKALEDAGSGSGGTATWDSITGKPATFPPTVGTTATTAKAGNYVPTSAEVAAALKAKTQINALAAVSVADATDATTAAALANANKAAINAVIAALKA